MSTTRDEAAKSIIEKISSGMDYTTKRTPSNYHKKKAQEILYRINSSMAVKINLPESLSKDVIALIEGFDDLTQETFHQGVVAGYNARHKIDVEVAKQIDDSEGSDYQ